MSKINGLRFRKLGVILIGKVKARGAPAARHCSWGAPTSCGWGPRPAAQETVLYHMVQYCYFQGEEEKGVVVLREYDDFEWLYHCLTTQNNVDGIVVCYVVIWWSPCTYWKSIEVGLLPFGSGCQKCSCSFILLQLPNNCNPAWSHTKMLYWLQIALAVKKSGPFPYNVVWKYNNCIFNIWWIVHQLINV